MVVDLVQELRRHAAEVVAGIDDAEIERAIGRWLADARAAWPTVALDDATFVAYVGARLVTTLDAVHTTDLWLALACLRGDAAACELFDAHFLRRLRSVLGQVGLTDCQIHQVLPKVGAQLMA